MKHVIKISQPDFVGSTVIAFDDEGKARLAVETLNTSGDGRTSAEYLGKANLLHLTFGPANHDSPSSLRAQAAIHYERALPHRVAFDVVGLKPASDDHREYECYILGGFRPAKEA